MTIGERLRNRRKSLKLTMKDITSMTGITSGNLSEIENNKYLPSVQALIPLSKALQCSIDWIATGEDWISEPRKSEQTSCQVQYAKNEIDLIEMFRVLDDRDREYVKSTIEMLYSKAFKKGISDRISSELMTGGTEEAATNEAV